MFTIPCVIGNNKVERAMLDLGASINVMPLSVYKALNLGPLKETRVIIQLADRSNSYPEGIVEDVLVKVKAQISKVMYFNEATQKTVVRRIDDTLTMLDWYMPKDELKDNIHWL